MGFDDRPKCLENEFNFLNDASAVSLLISGRSQNTVPIASTQVAIKGIVQYSTRAQLATRHSREHTLSAVGPDAQVE